MVQSGIRFTQQDASRVTVRDLLSEEQYDITTAEPVNVDRGSEASFPAPVTSTVALSADELQIDASFTLFLLDDSGTADTFLDFDESHTTGPGVHYLDITAPVKTYIRIDGPLTVTRTKEFTKIQFADAGPAIVGARAWQCYPEATITVTDSPTDYLEAISYFGADVLTSSPERSFPTLRGHPPELERGETLEIPSELSRPETGLTVTVPPNWTAALSVTPLVYYLRATATPGDEFSIRTASGYTYRPDEDDITTAAQTVLGHCFYLDCLTRTEGLYPVSLHERERFEATSDAEIDFAELYDMPLPERTEAYLQLDGDVVDEVTPPWPLTAVVEPKPSSVEALPYLTQELAFVQPAEPPRYTGDEAKRIALDAFKGSSGLTRSTSVVFDNRAEFVEIPDTNSQQTVWVGDGIPLNAAAFMTAGYKQASLVPADDESAGELEITVVCNDAEMDREPAEIETMCDPRDDLPLDLTTHSRLRAAELRDVIESGTDYLHFVGHATPDGLQCVDEYLDVSTVAESNVDTFFLNACQSFRQGRNLVEQGSFGGIVTYSDVTDTFALEIGSHVGRLLNAGFPIGACLTIIRSATAIGGQYTVVGNHAANLAQPSGGAPAITDIRADGDDYELTIHPFTTGAPRYNAGTIMNYAVPGDEQRYLIPSSTSYELTRDQLVEFLSLSDEPVIVDGELEPKAEVLADLREDRLHVSE